MSFIFCIYLWMITDKFILYKLIFVSLAKYIQSFRGYFRIFMFNRPILVINLTVNTTENINRPIKTNIRSICQLKIISVWEIVKVKQSINSSIQNQRLFIWLILGNLFIKPKINQPEGKLQVIIHHKSRWRSSYAMKVSNRI